MEVNMKLLMSMIMSLTVMVLVTDGYAQMGHGMMGGGMHDYSPFQYNESTYTEDMRISRGGQLYDNWWRATTKAAKPEGDHPLWKLQDTNKRKGYATYRCKECHGWDYMGKDGAYGKGSHYTGFKGVREASQKMSAKEIEDVLKGGSNKDHDFSRYLSDSEISDLALFIKKGLTDSSRFVTEKGEPIGGDLNSGAFLFNANCTHMCHGRTGTMINFGSIEKPEFVGTVAYKNPWEFIHKVRAGQPGTKMPSAIIHKWSDREILDLLTYVRTLPKDADEARRFGGMMMGGGMGHHQWSGAGNTRGFGPIIK
jgi:thiosulfate dehydrogenase